MGVSMNIHTPTVNVVSSSSGARSNAGTQLSNELQRLMKQRANIESELDELVSVLERVSSHPDRIPLHESINGPIISKK